MSESVRIEVVDNYDDLSRRGADLVLEYIREKPAALLCAPSGSSPLGVYSEMAKAYARESAIFSKLRVIKLDEWGPLATDDPASCEFYVRTKVIEPLAITEDRYISLRGDARDPENECKAFASALAKAGPIDICMLGLGVNGHVGMNEPAEWLHETAHVAELARESHGHAMLEDARTQPAYGLTLGMGDIVRSDFILLLVSGDKKRDAMTRLMSRQITTRFPASLLWTHRNTVIIADREAYPNS